MAKRSAKANWEGGLKDGKGSMALGSGAFEGSFSFNTRMGDEPGTNPEELLGAALAGCFTMALSATLEKEGHAVKRIDTDAKVEFGKDDAGFAIKFIDLETTADVDGLDDAEFQRIAADVKKTCPVSKALSAVPINLTAKLANA
ncbi:MAG: OsmC family protein [Saprospiraceae bacterium]|nr:OsmC family protein [Pyrinomonadaceae bacterium]